MVTIIRFHVGKNDVISRGIWTLTCPEKEKNRKKLTFTGFDPGTFRSQEQNTTTELRRHITLFALKKLENEYSYDTVLANFSQVAPLCATLHPYSTILDLFPQLFCLYNFPGLSGTLFQKLVFGSYLWNPWKNFQYFCSEMIHFIHTFLQFTWNFRTFIQTPEKKSCWRNLGF